MNSHGRVECPKCGDVWSRCRCFQHENAVTYVECAACAGRGKKEEVARPEPETESPFQIKKVEQRIVGNTLIYDVLFELKTELPRWMGDMLERKKDAAE